MADADAPQPGNQAPAASQEAVGSVWNDGDYHWEERNWKLFFLQAVADNMKAIALKGDDVKMKFTELLECRGDASVNVRKGKQVAVFDLTMRARWCVVAQGHREEGTIAVFDVMQDDVDRDFEVLVETHTRGPASRAADGLMLQHGRAAVRHCIRSAYKKLQEKQASDEQVKEARLRRAEEQATAAAAAKATGEEQAQLAAAAAQADDEARQQRVEAERAEQEAAGAAAAAAAAGGQAGPQPAQPAPAHAVVEAEGQESQWNRNGFHWEEKDLTAWARERLGELLRDFVLDEVPHAAVKIVEVTKMEGEASTMIRRGKKLVFFDFNIECGWEGELFTQEGEVVGTGDGSIVIPSLDQDTPPEEIEFSVQAAHDGGPVDVRLSEAMREQGLMVLCRKLREFALELKHK